jgi:hypothetical protein
MLPSRVPQAALRLAFGLASQLRHQEGSHECRIDFAA